MTSYPQHPDPQALMSGAFNCNVGEVCDEATCYARGSDFNAIVISLLTAGAVHTCSLTGVFIVIFVPRMICSHMC